MRGSISIGETK